MHSHPGNPQYLIFSADLHHQLVTTFLLPVESYACGKNDSTGGSNGETPAGVQQGVFERLVEAVADGVDHSHQSDVGHVLWDGGGIDREGEEQAAVYGFSDEHCDQRHAGETSIPYLNTNKKNKGLYRQCLERKADALGCDSSLEKTCRAQFLTFTLKRYRSLLRFSLTTVTTPV